MLSDTKYSQIMGKMRREGAQQAENEWRSGCRGAQEAPFSGEYADGLTLQKVLDRAGQPAMVEELTGEEEQDFMQAFEDEYFDAWEKWTENDEREARDYIAESEGLVMPSYAS